MVYKLNRLMWLLGLLPILPMAAAAPALAASGVSQSVTVQSLDRYLAQAPVQITAVRVAPAETGLQLTLEATGTLEAPQTEVVGNALIAEIPNAVLALPEGDSFEQFSPAAGIALVSLTTVEGNRVQVAITGTEGPPTADIRAGASGLVLGIVPG